MLAVALFFMGQFALFTYLRPFLERVTQLSVPALSAVLLTIGVAGVAGTWLIGLLLRRSLYGLLVAMPSAMAAIALGLIAAGSSPVAAVVLLALWGLIGTAAPVAWWTWLSKVLPDSAQAGGGLMVAVIQLAITLGASTGGLLFDMASYRATFAASASLLCASALVAFLGTREARAALRSEPEAANDPLAGGTASRLPEKCERIAA